MEFSKEQQTAFDLYRQGTNLFITGPGGTGKSALIQKIYEHAYDRFKNIQVCAMTGCAAVLLNCNAKTLHSWAGIGIGTGTPYQLVEKIKKNKFAIKMWRDTDILVIDEVSMLSLKLFDTLNEIGKTIRRNGKPWGGIQLIFSGDFFQLPPVGDRGDPDSQRFCFESDQWNIVFSPSHQIQLVKIFRQKDEVYSTLLNQIRQGKIKRKTNDLLLSYVGREYDASLVAPPTQLFPTRRQVDNINHAKMRDLEGESHVFDLKYLIETDILTNQERAKREQFTEKEIQMELEFLANNLICDKKITLKVGSQVMCIVNIQKETAEEKDKFAPKELLLCNGSQGIVTNFCPTTGFPMVKFNSGLITMMTPHVWNSEKIPGLGVAQIPLILAWALTIHKSQGATMDAAEIDAGSGIFECGQTYVALSRVKNLEGLYLKSFDVRRILVHNKVKEYYEKLNHTLAPITKNTIVEEGKNLSSSVVYVEARPITNDMFSQFNYVEAHAELITDHYEE